MQERGVRLAFEEWETREVPSPTVAEAVPVTAVLRLSSHSHHREATSISPIILLLISKGVQQSAAPADSFYAGPRSTRSYTEIPKHMGMSRQERRLVRERPARGPALHLQSMPCPISACPIDHGMDNLDF